MAPASPAPASNPITVAVDWTQSRQTIDGFGASGAFQRAAYLMALPEPARGEILDALFSRETGAGLSIVRNIIGDGSPLPDGVPTIEPAPGQWNWTGDEAQIWLMREAAKRGVARFVSTAWSAPAWMKDNHSVIGGSLAPDHGQDFADYLAAYVRGYETRFGLVIYAISFANEPSNSASYSSSLWTGPQIRDFVKTHLAPTFARDGLAARIIIGEDETWSEDLAADALADPAAARAVNIVAAHGYLGGIRAFPRAAVAKKTIWQSEVSHNHANDPTIADGLAWARTVHACLTEADASAFLYWWFVSRRDNGGALVILNPADPARYLLNKRLFTLGNYARFVRPGYVRLDCDANPAPGLFTSAYKEPGAGRFVFIAINAGDAPLPLRLSARGFRIAALTPYVTDDARNLRREADSSPDSFVLSPRSVATFVGKAAD